MCHVPSAICQLLGIKTNTPTGVMFSFAGLATRAQEHKDGFGTTFFKDRGLHRFIDHHGQRRPRLKTAWRSSPLHR